MQALFLLVQNVLLLCKWICKLFLQVKEKKKDTLKFCFRFFFPQINSLSIRLQGSIPQIKYSIRSPDVFYALLHCTYLSTSGILMLRVLQGFFFCLTFSLCSLIWPVWPLLKSPPWCIGDNWLLFKRYFLYQLSAACLRCEHISWTDSKRGCAQSYVQKNTLLVVCNP